MMQARNYSKDPLLHLLETFLTAGSSALILSIAHIHPELWYISMFALVPFLWRVTGVGVPDSVLLSVILASCYVFVAYPNEMLVAPMAFLLKFFYLNLIFAIFGIAVNRVKKHIGFCPVFIAALWLPLEYILTHFSGLGNIFAFTNVGSGFVVRFASLFGFLMVSFAIVLINSLILKLIEYVGRKVFASGDYPSAKGINVYSGFEEIAVAKIWYFIPELRAPPLPA